MARSRRRSTDAYDSDASFSPETDDVFDLHDGGLDTDATDIEDDVDMDDCIGIEADADPYDSDDDLFSFSAEDLFDLDDGDDLDTNTTDIEGNAGVNDCIDIHDPNQLFGGNLRPPEYYRQAVAGLNLSALKHRNYKPNTRQRLEDIQNRWRLYCEVLKRDPQQCYESLDINLIYNFFDWVLCQKVGKDGRRMRGVKKISALNTYWKYFLVAYNIAVGHKIDSRLADSMKNGLKLLAETYGLSQQRRPNRCMTIDDLKKQIEETLSTTRKSFKLGELRILAVLFLLLLSPAGSRPLAILQLRYRDIRVVLKRDPEGGPHNILIHFTEAFTKTYLGEKDEKTFPIPETLYDPSLLLSPHVFLLGILFRHQAFRSPLLTSPHQLDSLDIEPGELEMRLPLKKEMDDVYVFRRAIETVAGYEISPSERITYAMMAAWIKRIGQILGFEYSTIAYSLRYNAGNEFDENVNVSAALRNLVMGHANSDPFRKHYLGRHVRVDLWGILRGQKPQQALVKQACSIGHSISKRRPIDLTAAQVASISTHPLIRRLAKRINELPRRSKDRKEAQRQMRNEKQRLKREKLQETREKWTDEQAVADIQSQLQGKGFVKSVAVHRPCPPQRPAQKRLLKALTAPLVMTLEAQYRRRDNAIDAIVAYCTVQEGCTEFGVDDFTRERYTWDY
ncbi:hypothetical protein K4K57_012998 [Colletotrichum sp. SAR 10_99]|nr:hypothetical protein K4K57_012998 [Colletotrichum sp. SAR 10_99]